MRERASRGISDGSASGSSRCQTAVGSSCEELRGVDAGLVVAGAEGARRRGGLGELVARPPRVEADREGAHRLVARLGHERQDGARVEPPREEAAEGHVADEAALDGPAHEALGVVGRLLEVDGGQLRPVGQPPPAADLDARGVGDHQVARRELAHLAEHRARRGDVAQRQVVPEPLVVDVRRHPGGQQRLDLRPDHQLPVVVGVVERASCRSGRERPAGGRGPRRAARTRTSPRAGGRRRRPTARSRGR